MEVIGGGGASFKRHCVVSLAFTSCVTLGESVHISESQCSHFSNRDNNSIYLKRPCEDHVE